MILIKNGRVVDPANNRDEILDILVDGKKIAKVAKRIQDDAAQIIDAKDKIVLPGLVDMHVHLREPGREDKETIETGTLAAVKGGITSVLAMPNTAPVPDCAGHISLVREIIAKTGQANVYICGAITRGRAGKELSDILELKKENVAVISDDGASVESEELMLAAFKKAKKNGVLVICHCEDKALSANGAVNLGFTSTRLGLRGISCESEYKRVKRDIALAKKTQACVHIAHVSCKESVEIIRAAKKDGIKVTSETAPHYFALTEDDVLSYDTNKKMNPPLRGNADLAAIKDGLGDGTIDAIASDHAPHTDNEKDVEFERAEFGVIGLETELAVAITELIIHNVLDWPALVNKMSVNPAKILGINKGTLSEGADADIIIVDTDKEWVVKKDDFVSKSQNCAFLGKKLKGVVEHTVCGGRIVYRASGRGLYNLK
ncbi:MAG: dihydroorotase [Candidatus Omnitrophica bacterium CG11_big_fil_rev_8_21_14_0_20_42_13]|uniref:Dihydroorotase n=1 Tax=Candidatus Ghiorseimicrobium undicola TaxID=1974746 RepID=A0A2H0LVR6_9BACT|nr:MAG: dihydroorotase [Candidatus Omnitrophica bacterium CG11_big_fil_rev_8_21_14_0_20_42_13]